MRSHKCRECLNECDCQPRWGDCSTCSDCEEKAEREAEREWEIEHPSEAAQ